MAKRRAKNRRRKRRTSLLKMRFDYAWKWFDFHARQRITLLNVFLIIVGVFFAAYGTLFSARAGHPDSVVFWTVAIVLGLGIFVSILFLLLDVRNRTLVHLAEDVLEKLETDLFDWPGKNKSKDRDLTNADPTEEYLGILVRQTRTRGTVWKPRLLSLGCFSIFTKHRFVIPVLVVLVIVAFAALIRIEWLASQSQGKNGDPNVHATVQRIRADVDQLKQDMQQLRQFAPDAESTALSAQVGSGPTKAPEPATTSAPASENE